MILHYNQRTAGVSFNQWLEANGIEVIDSWDTGMYGNIGFTVRRDDVEHKAHGYQSVGMSPNFTFDLIIEEK